MRYFLEVAYKGTQYSGFQTQQNANTVQAEVEKALFILLKETIQLTGSSRTDAGVHALQNYFHFDSQSLYPVVNKNTGQSVFLYKLNALLPRDIVAKKLIAVANTNHCRFDALSREYKYFICREKNPFLQDRAYFYPYTLDIEKLTQAADMIKQQSDFTSFSKKNTQVKTYFCTIFESQWIQEQDCLVYQVKANRFLRGMVRALTATMLLVGRKKISLEEFRSIFSARDCTRASFAVPAQGLFLTRVHYPDHIFTK